MPRVLNKRTDQIPADAVYVGRPSKWGNPFKVQADMKGQLKFAAYRTTVKLYREWILGNKELLEVLPELKGKDLVCWCAPLPCHADILLELANK